MDQVLFQQLAGGAKFNRKKFSDDISAFQRRKGLQPRQDTDPDADDALNFFGEKRKKRVRDETDEETSKRRKRRKTREREEEHAVSDGEARDDDASDDETAEVRPTLRPRRIRAKNGIKVKGSDVPDPAPSFQVMRERDGLDEYLEKNMMEIMNFVHPTAIQMQAIPALLARRSVLACAPTGSGKTAAFLAPLLAILKKPRRQDAPRGLVLSPTRELAVQTYDHLMCMAHGRDFKSFLLSTAESSLPKKGESCDIVVSTPLRLLRLVQAEELDLSKIEYCVLDEGDQLFDLGFLKQVDRIIAACTNETVQIALFSATLLPQIEELAQTILRDPVRIVVGHKNSASMQVKQELIFCGREDGKVLAVRQLIEQGLKPPIIVFVQSKERAVDLFKELLYDGIKVDCITSDRTQEQRDNSVRAFRTGKTWVLISSDLMARGMDFKAVNVVINFDIPPSVVQYIHRVGRAGRAGRTGRAVTLYTEQDIVMLRSIAMVMENSGMVVPEWIHGLPKVSGRKKKEFVFRPPKREAIGSAKSSKEMESKLKRVAKRAEKARKKRLREAIQESEGADDEGEWEPASNWQ